jgi:glycosyltransferase involved in cell wall biosynthesis
MPEVTVVIPTYNRAQFVADAIQSVLDQTFQDFELIVVDDGSTDATADVVGRFSDSRLRYVYQSNQERSAARNHGIRLAAGEYVAFLDSDDMWLPTKLEKQVHAMTTEPQAGLVYTGAYIFEGDRVFAEQHPRWHGQVLEALLTVDNIVCGSGASPMVRRMCFEKAGMFDESSGICGVEDWDMWLRIAAGGYAFSYVPEPLVRCRVHGGNTLKNAEMMERATRAFFAKILAEPSYFAGGRISRRRVESLRELMVGRSFYTARQMNTARRCFLSSLRLYPLQRRAGWYLARSLAGGRLTELLRRIRNTSMSMTRYQRHGRG